MGCLSGVNSISYKLYPLNHIANLRNYADLDYYQKIQDGCYKSQSYYVIYQNHFKQGLYWVVDRKMKIIYRIYIKWFVGHHMATCSYYCSSALDPVVGLFGQLPLMDTVVIPRSEWDRYTEAYGEFSFFFGLLFGFIR